jgi:hypothetical protein
MMLLLGCRGTGILPVGQAGVSPAVYLLAGKMPASSTAKMAVLLLL